MSNLLNLRKLVVPEVVFGCGARKLAGSYAQQFSAVKALVVSDAGVQAAGWVADVEDSLRAAGVPYHVFIDVTPNPRSGEIMAGADVYREAECDIIVAIGGGSPMDCAKGIGVVTANKRHILGFEGVDRIPIPVPPLVFIPTTAGTSADVSQFCIVCDREELKKVAIVSKAIVPDVALVDPETTTTMDPYLTACTGIDALVHAVEAFVSLGSGPLTDSSALEAIRLIGANLADLAREPARAVLRERVMLASLKAGVAFSNASLGGTHAMAHSLGGFLDLPHGECNAMLLEHVIRFNFDRVPERFRAVADALGIDTRGMTSQTVCARLTEAIGELKREVGITCRLTQRGVHRNDIPELSRKAVRDACMLTNPRRATERDIEVMYEEAM